MIVSTRREQKTHCTATKVCHKCY